MNFKLIITNFKYKNKNLFLNYFKHYNYMNPNYMIKNIYLEHEMKR